MTAENPTWVNVRGCGWHHYTPENIDAIIRDLKAVEQGTETPEWINRDHRARCGILWRVISALSHEVPLNPDPVTASDGTPDRSCIGDMGPTYTHEQVRHMLDDISTDARRFGLEVVDHLNGHLGLRERAPSCIAGLDGQPKGGS